MEHSPRWARFRWAQEEALADAQSRLARMESGLVSLQQKVDALTGRVDALTGRVDAQAHLMTETADRIGQLANGLGELTRQLDQVAQGLHEVRSSGPWRWFLRLRRFRQECLHGTWAQRRSYLRGAAAQSSDREPAPPPPPVEVTLPEASATEVSMPAPAPDVPFEQRVDVPFEQRVDAFLDRVAGDPAIERFVVMFSSTVHLRPDVGNRPNRITETLIKQGVPVIYSYWRWFDTEPIPVDEHPLLLQSPVDKTVAMMERIARHPLGGKQRVFIASIPHLACARWVNVFNASGWVTLYECRDDWDGFYRAGAAPWYQRCVEGYLVNNCDATLCTARALQDKMRQMGPGRTVVLSPNALDPGFVSAENQGRTAPRDGDPIIGYFGHLSPQWFDWGILTEAARSEPTWRFELIGRGAPEGLQLPPNICLLGPRTPTEINEIARSWRVGLIPFKMGPLSDAVDPIKVYEYLALGLPVVSLRMAQIAGYPYVLQASDTQQLTEQVAVAMRLPLDRQVIDAFLESNRWEDRVQQLLALADASREADPLKGVMAGLSA